MADKPKTLDFDAKGEEKVRNFLQTFFDHAQDAQRQKHEEFRRAHAIFRNQMSMTGRDPNRANIFVPKAYSLIQTIVPHYVDAIFGMRPYIPVRLNNNAMADIGNAMTDLLDAYLEEGDFFVNFTQLINYVVPYGTGFIESYPDFVKREVTSMQPQMLTMPDGQQMQVGAQPVTEEKVFFKLGIRSFAPWQIYKDPNAKSMDDARGIIKFRGLVSKRQMQEMSKRGAFPDFDWGRLDKEAEGNDMVLAENDDWCKKIARDIGVSMPKYDDDLGIWLSYESNDRYIDIWNLWTVMRDIPNPYKHGKINCTRVINTFDTNPETSWWGIGEIKPIEQLIHGLNENWNQSFNNHNMQNEGIIFYEEDALSVDQLVMVAGNRVPVDPGPNRGIKDVIYERVTPPLSPDHYKIPSVFENMIDETSGIHDITRGEATPSGQTAREAILRTKAGESRMRLKIKIGEQMGLRDFGLKALSTINQFAGPDDIVDKIGLERAMLLPTVNPMAIDGGFSFGFAGSDRLAQQQVQRQDAKDIFQLAAGNPSVRQDMLADWMFKKFDIPDADRRKMVIPDEVVQQMQMMMQAQEAQAESTRAISGGQPIGSSGGYSPSGRDKNEKLGMNI